MNNSIIAVVTVNFCTADFVCKGLEALSAERKHFPNLHVVVVDNASSDDSLEVLNNEVRSNRWQEWVKIVSSKRNGGFSYGNNLGFKVADQWLDNIDYFWMLNPDVEVLPDSLSPLVSFAKANRRAIVGSGLQDRSGERQISAFNFPSILSELCSGFGLGILDKLFANDIVVRPLVNHEEKCDWLAGASLLISAEIQKAIGPMDERYFLYFEEVDYLKHAKSHGFECWYIPASRVIHEVGASTGISNLRKKQPRRPSYWFESRRYFFLKNHGRVYLFFCDLFWATGYVSWYLRNWVTDRELVSRQPPRLLLDFLKSSQLNPINWAKRY